MRVVIAINTAWNIYNFRRGLIEALLSEGMEVIAVSPEDEYSPLIETLGCQYVPIRIDNKGTNPLNDYSLYKRFLKVYAELKPDVILHYTIKPNIYGTLAAKSLGIPVINNVSGLGTVFLHRNPIYKVAQLLYKYAFKHPSKVFFQNNDDLRLFVKMKLVDKSICDVLPGSGVNISSLKQVEYKKEDPFKFLMLARVLHDKGVNEYVEASKILKEKGYNCKVQIAGALDSSSMGIPSLQVKEWHNEGVIEYLGEVRNVYGILSDCQCAVLPSYREGTPKSLLEAGAVGRPIIATNVPGCKEVVVDKETGYLCRHKSATDLADKMEKMLLLDEEHLKKMSNNSRRFIEENFDERFVIVKYIKAIKEIECK